MMKSFLKPVTNSVDETSVARYNKELDEAMERIDKGIYITMEDLEKEMRTW
ncbi:hypothetical protein [Niabella hibiscisoli]|uniref:hypothetical protein n=1 Tax=Niabella hibiscisoli TaxID=1825928 RepID=UPI001F0F6DC1|nr:hypothetical protein [Niabella hibiscisoli]MCH5716520.1 hypothetical protein [Niabella hibiscisoli]